MNPAATMMVELDRDECLRLISSERFGRLAVNMTGWAPLIRPVNYLYDDYSRSVIIRTADGTKLYALTRSEQAAFEVDSIDRTQGTGWSVIVLGVTEEIHDVAELRRLTELGFTAWAPGLKDHWLRIRCRSVSGRRILLADRGPDG